MWIKYLMYWHISPAEKQDAILQFTIYIDLQHAQYNTKYKGIIFQSVQMCFSSNNEGNTKLILEPLISLSFVKPINLYLITWNLKPCLHEKKNAWYIDGYR